MRFFFGLLMVVCVGNNSLWAQVLQHSTEEKATDTSAINELLKKGYTLREINPDSAALIYQKALNASRIANYKIGIADALCGLGRFYNIQNQQRRAIGFLQKALPYCDSSVRGREKFIAAYLLLSESYYYIGRYDSCVYYRYEALNQMESSGITDPVLRLRVYSKILQFWLNAHADIRNDKYIAHIMQNINELEKGALARNDSSLLVNVFFQKEGYYHNISENDSARYYGLQSIALGHRQQVIPSMMMAAYLNMALTYMDDKAPDSAILCINKAVVEAPEQGRSTNRYLLFADIFLGKALAMKKQYLKAIAVTEPALARADELSLNNVSEIAYETLADAYEATGNFEASARNRKLYAQLRDSLMKTEKMEIGYNLDMKYRVAEKNKELAQKELAIVQNKIRIRSKNIWIGSITAGLLLITAISVLLYRNSKHKQKLQSEKIYMLQQEMEIKLLKAMISGTEKERSRIARDLHDGIGGTLGSIRAQLGMLYKKQNPNEAHTDYNHIMQLLAEASADLRKTAHNLMPEILLQEGLVAATELFCERAAKGYEIDLKFASYGEAGTIPPELEMTLYRTIQELVQNILKHAAAKHALVQLNFNGPHISLTVEDDGKGMNNIEGKNVGMGLKTIASRIQSLQGTMDIDTKPEEGTSIYIELDTNNSKV